MTDPEVVPPRSAHILNIGDSRSIVLGERTPGGSKNETRFGTLGTQQVVVKIQRTHGRLEAEEVALRFLAGGPVLVPEVIASGTTEDGDPYLVLSREEGEFTSTAAGWERFGRDLARLAHIPISHCPLPRISTALFHDEHQRRLEVLEHLLDGALARQIEQALDQVRKVDQLVVTHGDPGTGNYLDNPSGRGVLLDWETASVSPYGLDLGRAAFIGFLDLGRSGIPQELASGLIRGYANASSVADQIDPDLLRSWITIGGLQFIHGRHTQPLRPDRTADIAAQVLADWLAGSQD